MRALDLTVVVDIAMTETARQADYVLPASSQFEKWECTFFNVDFPKNVFHLRAPLMEPSGTLAEPEIYARVIRELRRGGRVAPGAVAGRGARGRPRSRRLLRAVAPTRG